MRKSEIDDLLGVMLESYDNVSDLNITCERPLQVEAAGELVPVPVEPAIENLTPFQTEIFALNLINNDRRLTEHLLRQGSCDSSYFLPGKARFRVNIFSQRGSFSVVLRKLETKIPTIEELKLPEAFKRMPGEKNGLIVVTGATGSGKTTSLAALLNEINSTKSVHVVTLEDPVEYVHPNRKATFNQRHHVHGLGAVDLVEEGGQRRRLAGSGGARDEDEPVLLARHPLEGLGELQLLDGRNLRLQLPEDDREAAALGEDVDAEARLAGQEVRRVARALAQQVLGETPVVVDQVQCEDLGPERRQVLDRGLDGDRHQLAGGLHLQRPLTRDVEVRHVVVRLQHHAQQVVDLGFPHGRSLLVQLVGRCLQHRLELRLVIALVVGLLAADPALCEDRHDRVVERLHAELLARLDGRRDLDGLALADP